MDDPTSFNRAHWDERAALHGRGTARYYDIDALVDGRFRLGDLEEAALAEAIGDVAGRDVLHLHCHVGFDGIALARRGARVTGADFSPVALAQAADLARRCGVVLATIEADSRALPASLHGRFDLVYATIGILGWIDDIDAWMASAAAALRPGGRLLLLDLHPLYACVGSLDPLDLDYPYGGNAPQRFEEAGSYADDHAETEANVTIEYPHSLGEIVTAAIGAGLRVLALHEHLDAPSSYRGGGLLPAPEEDGRYRLRIGGQPLPMAYTLIAERS